MYGKKIGIHLEIPVEEEIYDTCNINIKRTYVRLYIEKKELSKVI